jgi:hypothetical protein
MIVQYRVTQQWNMSTRRDESFLFFVPFLCLVPVTSIHALHIEKITHT